MTPDDTASSSYLIVCSGELLFVMATGMEKRYHTQIWVRRSKPLCPVVSTQTTSSLIAPEYEILQQPLNQNPACWMLHDSTYRLSSTPTLLVSLPPGMCSFTSLNTPLAQLRSPQGEADGYFNAVGNVKHGHMIIWTYRWVNSTCCVMKYASLNCWMPFLYSY